MRPLAPRDPVAVARSRAGAPQGEERLTLAGAINAALAESSCGGPSCSSSARTSARRAASTASRAAPAAFGAGARLRHAPRRDSRSSGSRWARRTSACSRSRRSSTSPTSTTRKTSSAARPPRSSSSRSGQFRNPMVVRDAGLGYQKGFGGHFHNDNSVGALRDIPGLVLAVPARGDDAARDAARRCVAAARTAASSSSSSRSRSTTSRTSTSDGDERLARTRRPGGRARAGGPGTRTRTATT